MFCNTLKSYAEIDFYKYAYSVKGLPMIVQVLDHITDEIKQIRIDVFMKEQGFEDEFDEIDEIAKFVLLYIDGKPAGTVAISQVTKKVMPILAVWRCVSCIVDNI